MKSIKNNKAITLIALIITIIILLIIAGVTISFTTGENGIFDKSKKGTEKYEMAEAKEQIELTIQDLAMEKTQKGEDFPTLKEIVAKLYADEIIIADDLGEDEGDTAEAMSVSEDDSKENTAAVTTAKHYLAEITLKESWQYEVEIVGKENLRTR